MKVRLLMKKWLFAAVLGLVVLLSTACTDAGTPTASLDSGDRDGFHLYVAAGSVTPTGLRLSMINPTDETLWHGTPFSVERYERGQWRPVPWVTDSISWHDIGLSVPPNDVIEENIVREHMYGALSPGTYRILREFNQAAHYAVFTVVRHWQEAHTLWLVTRDA